MHNKVILVGNLADDAEIRRTQTGDVLAKFRLIETDKKRDKLTGDLVAFGRGHNIVVYGLLAKYCEKAALKGNLFLVEGKLDYRTFKTDSGHNTTITEIVVSQSYGTVTCLSSKQSKDS